MQQWWETQEQKSKNDFWKLFCSNIWTFFPQKLYSWFVFDVSKCYENGSSKYLFFLPFSSAIRAYKSTINSNKSFHLLSQFVSKRGCFIIDLYSIWSYKSLVHMKAICEWRKNLFKNNTVHSFNTEEILASQQNDLQFLCLAAFSHYVFLDVFP